MLYHGLHPKLLVEVLKLPIPRFYWVLMKSDVSGKQRGREVLCTLLYSYVGSLDGHEDQLIQTLINKRNAYSFCCVSPYVKIFTRVA